MSATLPTAVLISGTGRLLRKLIELRDAGRIGADLRLVISSHPGAQGLEHAGAAGIPCEVVTRKACGSDAAFSEAIFERLRAARIELVVMAGFIKYLPIPSDYELRVVNIHPALIPAFCGHGYYGHRVHQAAVDYGVKISGCTVHLVDNQYDHGPIILQRPVPVRDDDTADSLAARVFQEELQALPEAINLIAAGRLRVAGRKVRIVPHAEPAGKDD